MVKAHWMTSLPKVKMMFCTKMFCTKMFCTKMFCTKMKARAKCQKVPELKSKRLRIVNCSCTDVTIVTQKFEFAEKGRIEIQKMKLNGPNGSMKMRERANGGEN